MSGEGGRAYPRFNIIHELQNEQVFTEFTSGALARGGGAPFPNRTRPKNRHFFILFFSFDGEVPKTLPKKFPIGSDKKIFLSTMPRFCYLVLLSTISKHALNPPLFQPPPPSPKNARWALA